MLYRKQTKVFTIISAVAAVIQLIIVTLGVVLVDRRGQLLECSQSGHQWHYITASGNWVITGHLIVLILQCAVTVQVLYKTPNKFNLLNNSRGDHLINKDVEATGTTTRA